MRSTRHAVIPAALVMAPEEAQANRLPHAWRPAWKRAAEAGGSLRGDGAEGTITIKAEAGTVHIDRAHVATLPTGERIELPAGTVLREAPDPILADLTERVGIPREMAPSVLRVAGVPVAEVTSIRFERTVRAENVPPGMLEDGAILGTVGPEGATIQADPDPWLAGLTLAAYNAARAGLGRGTSAKAGVAALMSAYTAGVERAISDYARART